MENSKYDKYWYFRTEADEDDDDDFTSSVMVPVKHLVSMIPTSTTTMKIFFTQSTIDQPVKESNVNGQHGSIILTITQGKVKDTIAELIALMNAGPIHSDGVKVIADDSTTDFDGTTRDAVYFSNITACGAINAR